MEPLIEFSLSLCGLLMMVSINALPFLMALQDRADSK